MNQLIPFNKPYLTGKELANIEQASINNILAGDGPFTKQVHRWLELTTGAPKALLTHSCTAALELAALLLEVQPGDEIIMPSYTFVSTANAFVLRGGVPVFIDVRDDTFNIDENLIETAITSKTKAIVPVHYAGVGAEMDIILTTADRHGLKVVEDAAQGVVAHYRGKPLGAIGDLGAYSFHETKNVISGEGGALLINDADFSDRAEIIREKGTDRSRFFRGQVDKYTWQEIGSSLLPGEVVAAFLAGQLEEASRITSEKLRIWKNYHELIAPLEEEGLLRRPFVPEHCSHNAHMYYVVLNDRTDRNEVLASLKANGVQATFHYVPLHSSPAGVRFGRVQGSMNVTETVATRLLRLPMWVGLTSDDQERVVSSLLTAVRAST